MFIPETCLSETLTLQQGQAALNKARHVRRDLSSQPVKRDLFGLVPWITPQPSVCTCLSVCLDPQFWVIWRPAELHIPGM